MERPESTQRSESMDCGLSDQPEEGHPDEGHPEGRHQEKYQLEETNIKENIGEATSRVTEEQAATGTPDEKPTQKKLIMK